MRVHALGHVLRVVADDDVVPEADLAFVGLLVHDHPHQGGLAGPVGAHECEVLPFGDGEFSVEEDALLLGGIALVRIGLAHVLHLGHDLATGRCGGELHEHLAQVLVLHFDAVQLFQFGDQALSERSFAGLRTELVDEGLGLLDVPLLILGLGRLLFALDLAQLHVLAPRHLAVDQFSVAHLDGALGKSIEEGLVVRDEHQRRRIVLQEILQPLDRGEIEVVGRFVQQQQVGPHEQQACELCAHAPATAKLTHQAMHVVAHEADAFQHALDLHVVVGRADGIEPFVRMCKDGGQFDGLFIGRGLFQVLLDALQLRVQHQGFFEGLLGHLPRGEFEVVRHLLRQIAQGEFLGFADGAFVEWLNTRQGLEQGALACAVATNQADAVVRADEEIEVVEHRPLTEMQGEALDRDHWAGGLKKRAFERALAKGRAKVRVYGKREGPRVHRGPSNALVRSIRSSRGRARTRTAPA